MVIILTTQEFSREVEKEIDDLALKVFIESLELAGGPRKIIEYRNLTWLPSLMRAAYVVVLKDKGYTIDQIAQILGISESTVKNILSADEKAVLRKLESKKYDELFNNQLSEEEKVHVAGGLAKLAYKSIKEKGDESIELAQEICKSLKVPWAVEVLEAIKGLHFPVEKDQLIERLKNIEIEGHKAEELLEKLEYPIRNPADLLHKIKLALEK